MSASWPLHVALVARLKAHPVLMARLTGGVWDGAAPQGTKEPYLVVGEPTESPVGVLGTDGHSETATLHVFSAQNGRKEVMEILALVDDALSTPLAITGHTSARLRREFLTVLVEDDGLRHAPVRYRAMTFANA